MKTGRLIVGTAISFALALAPHAQASTARATSAPNGDVGVTSSSGASTNKDKDRDFNTVTQGDRLGLFYAVSNGRDEPQAVHVTVVLDGPGTARDATLVDEDVTLGPKCPNDGGLCTDIAQDSFEFQVKRATWPAGTYSLTVTGVGTETATAVSTFTIRYR
jgi:hypothetical protein